MVKMSYFVPVVARAMLMSTNACLGFAFTIGKSVIS